MQTLNNTQGGVQLPDDVKATGYVMTRPFHYEQTFSSSSCGFSGTESAFIEAGHAYRFTQCGFKRRLSSK